MGGARVTTLVTLRKCTLGHKREIKTLKFVSASTKGFKGGLAWIKPSKKDMAVTFSYSMCGHLHMPFYGLQKNPWWLKGGVQQTQAPCSRVLFFLCGHFYSVTEKFKNLSMFFFFVYCARHNFAAPQHNEGAFSHSARIVPFITVFTPVTALKTCHL